MSVECDCLLRGNIEVPYRNVDRQRDIVFVGESPGHVELKLGEPFVGPSGKLLRNAIKTAKLDLAECAICNSARCLIDKKKLPTKQITEVLKSCRPRLENSIRAMRPKILILLGDIALKQVLKTSGITKKRGRFTFNEEFDCWVMPTFHPAYILRAREMEPYLIEDLRAVKRFIDNDYTLDDSKEKADYREVKSIRSLLMAIKESEGKVYVALDTETQGLNHNDPEDSFLISYSISALPNTGYQVFLRELWREGDSVEDIDRTYMIPDNKNPRIVTVKRSFRFREKLLELKELVDSPNVMLFMQNGKFDKHHIREEFKRSGMEPPNFTSWVLDLQIAAHVIEENMYKTVSLESLSRTFLQKNDNWKEDFSSEINKSAMIEAPKDKLTAYACEDADNTLQIGIKLGKILSKDERLLRYFRKVAMPICSEALFTLEENGIYIDSLLLPITKEEIKKNVSDLHKKAIDLIPQTILNEHVDKGLKLSRNHFIADVLFNPLGFGEEPVAISNSSGIPMVNSNVRSILKSRSISDECREFLDTLEEWSETNNLLGKIVKQVEAYICPDGRLRSTFSNNQAVTGRVSSSRPNLMSIPKRLASAKHINRLIAAPSDEWLLAEADASQSELRCIASTSQDTEMMRVYKNDEDIHLNTAKALAKGRWDEMSKEEQKSYRTRAKCFRPDTEVLTPNGWIALADYDTSMKVMQATVTDTGGIVLDFVYPLFFENRPNHCETLVHLYNEGMDIHVTPDHRMLVAKTKLSTLSVVEPKDVIKARYWKNAGILYAREDREITPTHIQLAVATQADGSYTNSGIKFGFSKTRKIERMRMLLRDIPHTESVVSNGKNKPSTCFYIGGDSAKYIKSLLDHDKTFPWWWLTLDIRLASTVVNELCYWDGTRNTKWTQTKYSSSLRKNCDVIQAICSVNNTKSTLTVDKATTPGWADTYRLSISNHSYTRGGNLKLTEYAHTGDVSVIGVPSSFMLVRGSKEGRQVPIIVGQSGNFGIVYGISPNGFVNYCRNSYGLVITKEEAISMIDDWFALYPGVPRYHERAIEACRKYGYSTSPLGRRRRLPQIHADDISLRSAAERQAINFPIQSMSSDMMLISLLEIMKDKRIDKTACFPCLFIHDSLLFQIRKEVVGEYIPIIKHHIEHPPLDKMFGIKLRVPLKADVKIGPNRTDMEEVKDGA